ncbi:ABC transporter [Parafrankia soli]|uniref:ABC transporter n=1 Tax=Parafrankia soli TaxID=2599596 RepID=A0A1S1PJ72_9ACTN|nr:ABC transporter [Parafrankia soli]
MPGTETTAARDTSAPVTRVPTWRRLLRDPQAVVTLAILVLIVVLGILAPLLAQHSPNHAELSMINAPVGESGYLLGGDETGRDIFSRLLYSINTAAVSALIGAGVALVVGVLAGLLGGYFGTYTRAVTEWLFSLIMTFPGVLLLIILMPLTGGDYRWTMLIFGVLLSPAMYRIVRNLVLGVRNELYVDAARVSGLSDVRILGRHVLSAVRGPVIIAAAFMAGASIGVQSGLAFLGVGSKQEASFGVMIKSGFDNLYIEPTQFLWPTLVLGVITASLVLLGNALRDTLEGSTPRPVRTGAGLRAVTPPAPAPATTTDATTTGAVTADAVGTGTAGTATATDESPALLRIRDLAIAYPTPGGALTEVVTNVNLTLSAGEALGLVGESGSGKSQTAFATLGVLPPEAVVTRGSIRLDGRELIGLRDAALRPLRGRVIAYIPQEPMSNLDPSYKVGAQLVEGVRTALKVSAKDAKAQMLGLLERCGIADPARTFDSYPHQISGGMAQRVLIAGAVASRPKLLIADEPTTALDVTVQAEILDLLRDLQAELDMAVLLVTHNFGVVADICDRIAVMRAGEIVETGDLTTVFREPRHAYTRMLLDAILDEDVVRTDLPASAARGGGTR